MADGAPDTAASRFAVNIRARRELNGLSQRDLAQVLVDLGHPSFRQQTVAEIERGARQVKLDEALALSRALGISLDSLVRPSGLAKQASELLDSAREARDSSRHAVRWMAERGAARRRLEQAIARNAGHEADLADELTVARRALAETDAG